MTSLVQNDLPTLVDKLGWQPELDRVQQRIADCETPHVLGIHGEWGSGKTSFMRQLSHNLGCTMQDDGSVNMRGYAVHANQAALQEKFIVIWFDAWRYQNEPTPVVALLHEIRRQATTMRKVWSKLVRSGSTGLFCALDSISEVARKIGVEGIPSAEKIENRNEKWDKEHHHERLSTDSIRDHLRAAIQHLLPNKNARLVVFIDDLDRCNPKAAVRLLEGLKIYMGIPQCVFVLGMNERVLVDAIREEISAPKEAKPAEIQLLASHYLEKICTDVYRLPLPRASDALLKGWLPNADHGDALVAAIGTTRCLPPNPRRLKALANQWSRFAQCVAFPADPDQQKLWAVRVLVVAYIHQFNRDLWERWHYTPDFWLEIVNWCKGDYADPNAIAPAWTAGLKLTENVATTAKIHPNPGELDNFWIGALIAKYHLSLNAEDFEQLLSARGVAS